MSRIVDLEMGLHVESILYAQPDREKHMIIVPDLEQGTTEWLNTRLGVLTASQACKLITPSLKLSSQRSGILAALVAERVTGESADDFGGSYWTERGTQLEDQALSYFSLQTGEDVRKVGFVYRDERKLCGCSPDAFDKRDDPQFGVELKCPKASTHVQYLLDDKAKKYGPQAQFSLWVTGLPVWYFMSYFPGLPPLLQRMEPDEAWQEAFNKHVPPFLDDVAEAEAKIRAL